MPYQLITHEEIPGAESYAARRWLALRSAFCDNGDIQLFWSSPGYSHCGFTAQRAIDDALAQRITAAFTTTRFDDPEQRQVLELEGCKGFIPGTPEGYDMLEAAAEAEGLV